jgi:GNAT superfamily N-acetyltransferase
MTTSTKIDVASAFLRLELATSLSEYSEDIARYFIESTGEIFAAEEESEELEVGTVRITQIKVAAIERTGDDPFMVADDLSQEACDAATDLLTEEARSALEAVYVSPFISNVLILNNVLVHPQYRNQGIGRRVVSLLIDMYDHCSILALKPFDFELPQIEPEDTEAEQKAKQAAFDRASKRLTGYYEKLGFRLILGKHMTYCTELRKQPSLAQARSFRKKYESHKKAPRASSYQ